MKKVEAFTSKTSLMMTRMNWLIELKIIFDEVQQRSQIVTITDLASLIKARIHVKTLLFSSLILILLNFIDIFFKSSFFFLIFSLNFL